MKVYVVIEEYDPYVHYPSVDSMTQQMILAVCDSPELAIQIRRKIVEEEAKRWLIELNEYALNHWTSVIEVCGSDYYIREYDVLSETTCNGNE